MRDLRLLLEVEVAPLAQKQPKKLDASDEIAILDKIKHFAQTGRPSPKPLVGSLKGLYRLRFEDHRAIVKFLDDVVYVMEIGNRDKAYRKR
jgi:mRNA-degrading endonuclease RelE of RelBE toxin-antitoxin system